MNSITRLRDLLSLARNFPGKVVLIVVSCIFFARRRLSLGHSFSKPVALSLQFKGHPFVFYIFNQMDLDILRSVFILEVWNISKPIDPKVIFDLGAHIGATALYFCIKYPNSKVYCFEPIPENIQHFKLNLQPFKERIVLIKSIVSSSDSDEVIFYKNNDSNLSSSLYAPSERSETITIPSVTLDSVVREYNITDIGIIKFNIEGAEYDIFTKCACLESIGYLIGEIHPDLTGKPISDFLKTLPTFKVTREMNERKNRKLLLLERIG